MRTRLLALLMAAPPLAAPAAAQRPAPLRPFPPVDEPRSVDGARNHPTDPDRGAAFTPLARMAPAAYADGVHAPAGADRASARHVSNAVAAQAALRPNAAGLSDLFWQWGQFLDHDITETPIESPAEPFPVPVPPGDPWFDPQGTGAASIPMARSFTVDEDGVQQQLNAITAWIDGSQVYGSDAERARALRTLDGTGRLRTSDGDLLPFNTEGLPNAPADDAPGFFLAGDLRANEQIGLTAMHVLFVREHNHWAERIAAEDRDWIRRMRAGARGDGGGGGGRSLTREALRGDARALTGDEIYELARAIVSAELQLVTYREWLPLLLGPGVLDERSVYDPALDGSIRNEFATAAFRLGHSMLSPTLLRLDGSGAEIPRGHIPLASAFFAPGEVVATGVEPILRGLVAQRAQELDEMVVDDVRNFLFGPPGAGGLDLASLNMQRGRDHGLPSYGAMRAALGLGVPAGFDGVSSDPAVAARLARAARSPMTLDLWVGGLAEDDVPGALVGPVFHGILVEQFRVLRDGDRLWYARQLPPRLVELVEGESMASVLVRSGGLTEREAASPFGGR